MSAVTTKKCPYYLTYTLTLSGVSPDKSNLAVFELHKWTQVINLFRDIIHNYNIICDVGA